MAIKPITDLTCNKCHYWVSTNPDGECHKNSPSPKITPLLDDRIYYVKWPVTSEIDFCAEWRMRSD